MQEVERQDGLVGLPQRLLEENLLQLFMGLIILKAQLKNFTIQ